MNIQQKMKKCAIILILMVIFTIPCIFYAKLNSKIINFFADEFNIVTNKNNLLVHFIDVDQADAIAINLPDNKTMLIDSGSKDVNTSYTNYLKENVIHSKTSNYIDYLVLTHADSDHIGGTLKIFQNFQIGLVLMPKIASTSATYLEIYNYVITNCNYKILGKNYTIANDGYKFTFFEIINNVGTNETSQLIKLEYLNSSFLFTGDIDRDTENKYVEKYGKTLNCDVLKVAHHGSSSSTSLNFLNVATPKYSVISVGYNEYGHPTDEVLNNLNKVNSKILRTDIDGDILFVVGKNYNLKQLNNNFYITNLSLDYVILIFAVDVVLMVNIIVIVLKKTNKKTKK